MSRQRKDIDMLNGPLTGKIISFALPIAASQILQQLFNTADLAVVGRFASSDAMAAVGSNTPVIGLVICLFNGLATGASVLIGNMIGRGEKDRIRRAIHSIFTVALISGFFLIFFGMFASRQILLMMNAPETVLPLAMRYLRLYFLAMPGIMVINFCGAILRAKGDSRRPFYVLAVSGCINVLLNLFFVCVCGMDVDGVAIATTISNLLGAGAIVWFLCHEEDPYRLSFKSLGVKKNDLWSMVKVGLPAGIQGMVFSLSNVVIQSAVNELGAVTVAGSAAGQTFEYLCLFVVTAFSQSTVAFTAQNYGAKDYERCKKVFRTALVLSACSTMAFSALYWFGRGLFLQLFTDDPAVMAVAEIRMMWIVAPYVLLNTYEIPSSALRGMGVSLVPAIITILGTCVLRVVYVHTIYAAGTPDYRRLMLIYPSTWVATGIAVAITYFISRRKRFAGGAAAEGSEKA